MSEAKKSTSSVESIKTIPFGGTDVSKGGVAPTEFFRKAEVFAATKGFDQALTTEIAPASWAEAESLTEEQKAAIKLDKQAQNFLLLSCHGDAYKIIESLETAFEMFQALKNRYDSKKLKDLVKVTAKLEKCYMKSDLEDPYLWILEMERLNRELEKCDGGTKRSDMQMKATILAKLPKRRYESVITSLNGKMSAEDFSYQDFIAEITDHYDLFVEPFKNRVNRENGENNKDGKGKHLALNTTSGKGGWRQFKGKCNKCGKQGHKARDCDQNNNNNSSGKSENAKSKVKCYNCQGFGHIARECPKKGESGMFVGMTHHGHGNWDEYKLKSSASTNSTVEYTETDKLAIEILEGVAENLKRKRDLNNAIHTFMWRPKQDKKARMQIRRAQEDLNKMSWADMCETTDDEEDETTYEDMKEEMTKIETETKMNTEDKIECGETKENGPEALETVESTEDSSATTEEDKYRMDKPSTGAEWFWDDHVFMTSSHQFEENGDESWLLDSGATTHVATSTKNMSNLKTAINGEHVRVGNNETLKATAIGDLLLEQEGTKKKLFLENVMVVPAFARNLISVGRLVEKGNEFISTKAGSSISNTSGERLEFQSGSDGMAYLFAQRVRGGNKVYATERIDEIEKETKEKQKKQSMDINEAHRKFGHATEKVVRKQLQELDITPTGQMMVCDGCARAKATQKRTNKVTTVVANVPGERIYMDTSGPYSETVAGSRYWFKFVDDKTRKSWDYYGARKSLITKALREILEKLTAAGIKVKFIRCDNAGEHMSELRKICDAEYCIVLEYTAPHTPQHNGVVERMFARDARRALAMMIAAGWTKELQAKLWAEATKTAALLGNMLPNTRSTVPPDEQFYGKKSELYSHLIEFGRVGYVTNRNTMKGKFKEKATAMVMIGYAEHHARDVYRMYNPITQKVIETRDVHAWADITHAANDIRMTMQQVFDPELVLEQVEPVEEVPIEAEDEFSSAHLIPDYEEELHDDLPDLIAPMSGSGRIDADSDRTFEYRPENDEERSISGREDDGGQPSIQAEKIIDEDSDESEEEGSIQEMTDDEDDDLPPLIQRVDNPEMEDDEDDEANDDKNENSEIEQTEREEKPQRTTTKLDMEMKRLGLDEPIAIEDDGSGMRTRSRQVTFLTKKGQVAFSAVLTSDPGEPKTFRLAMDGKEGAKWKPSAKSEIMNFLSRKAWRKYPRKKLKGRKPIPVKWIFKKKDEQDGTVRYKSRVVLKGYVMIPGVDYTESFSPVATDTTVRVTIGLTLYRSKDGWINELIDIEAAFLNADLDSDTPIYAEWPEGMVELGFITEQEREENCIELTRPMYGGVDVPRLFMKTLKRHLTEEMKMVQSLVDPCLYYWLNEKKEVILLAVVHVDDVLLSGTRKTIDKFKTELRKRFNISELGLLKKHLGVWYDWKKDKNGETYVVASMPKLEDEIIELYETTMKKSVKETETPGYPNKVLSKNTGETVRMTEYRSLVGKIMYLMTKLAPDLANPARELAQHLSNPGEEHWKSLERMVGYIKAKHYEGLIYRKPKELRAISFVDSDYAKNTDDRKSISSGLHTLGGTLVNWESKTQHVVTLSSTEAEYISLAKGACENKFITMLLDEAMRFPKEQRLVGRIYEDNLGAIYLVKNQHVGARTKHIDVRAHFIRELEEQKYLTVQFVRSEENSADILNKNCPEKLHTKHAKMIRTGTLECWREDVEDKRLLTTDSSGTVLQSTRGSGTVMSTESCFRGNRGKQKMQKIHGKKFEEIYSGFVNGIPIPTGEVQHARMHEPSAKVGTASPINSANEGEWIEVKNKVKKVRFMCQDRFGKTSMNG